MLALHQDQDVCRCCYPDSFFSILWVPSPDFVPGTSLPISLLQPLNGHRLERDIFISFLFFFFFPPKPPQNPTTTTSARRWRVPSPWEAEAQPSRERGRLGARWRLAGSSRLPSRARSCLREEAARRPPGTAGLRLLSRSWGQELGQAELQWPQPSPLIQPESETAAVLFFGWGSGFYI